MAPGCVLVAGLEAQKLPRVPVLQREPHVLEELPNARALIARLTAGGARLLLLGPGLGEAGLGETIRRIRRTAALQRVSILVVLPETAETAAELLEAGANAVLQQPLDQARYETWVVRLLSVSRRLAVRVAVEGEVLATPRQGERRHFAGLTRNLSQSGLLLASPLRLATAGIDLELEMHLDVSLPRLRALGRVVREAHEVPGPYLGYGVEFLFMPQESQDALRTFLENALARRDEPAGIHSTVKRAAWIYEILTPVPLREGWQVEIRRAVRESWRPGDSSPFYVVAGATPEAALEAAREFVQRRG